MKIDNYKSKYDVEVYKLTSLEDIFNRIKKINVRIEKNKRSANVFATRSNKGRRQVDIKGFTGLMFIDIDDCTDYKKVKEFFMSTEYTIATWFSSSGKNVHALIKIPICKDVNEFKRRYNAFIKKIEYYIKDIALIDKITSNPTQLAFESYDPEIYINFKAIEFTVIEPVKKQRTFLNIKKGFVGSDRQSQYVIDKLTSQINSIVTNGHHQIINYGRWLGGQIGGGYIDESTARKAIEQLIYSNEYLNSNRSSGTIKSYLKTTNWAIDQGIMRPFKWE